MLREAVRRLAEDKIAPHAAEVDETGEFPQDVYDALRKADLHAVHIPEEYGGAGADALATAHRDRGGRPGLRVVLADPGGQQAGHDAAAAVRLRGAQAAYLPPVAAGDAMFSYALSEPEAGSDAAAMKTRAVRDGDSLGAQRRQVLDHQRGRVDVLHGDGRDRPGRRRERHLRVRGARSPTTRASPSGTEEGKLGIKGSPTCEVYFDDCRIPADRMIGEPGTGFKTALRTLDHTRVTIAAQAVGIAPGRARRGGGVRQGAQAVRQGRSRDFQGIQFMLADMAMKIEAARQLTYVAAGQGRARRRRT